MLKIGKMTDYAFVVLQRLCIEDGAPQSAQALALATGLSEPTVSKVLKTLAKTDLISSLRGAGGGYRAEKTVDQISVLDIVEAIEGPVSVVDCVEVDTTCAISDTCGLRGRWVPVNESIRSALEGWTLADLQTTTPNEKIRKTGS